MRKTTLFYNQKQGTQMKRITLLYNQKQITKMKKQHYCIMQNNVHR